MTPTRFIRGIAAGIFLLGIITLSTYASFKAFESHWAAGVVVVSLLAFAVFNRLKDED